MSKVADAIAQKRGAKHGHVGADHQQFDDILGTMYPACGCQVSLNSTVQNADPGQREAQGLRSAEQNVRFDLQFIEIDVWFVEAIEQHERICAYLVKSLRHVVHVAEKGT